MKAPLTVSGNRPRRFRRQQQNRVARPNPSVTLVNRNAFYHRVVTSTLDLAESLASVAYGLSCEKYYKRMESQATQAPPRSNYDCVTNVDFLCDLDRCLKATLPHRYFAEPSDHTRWSDSECRLLARALVKAGLFPAAKYYTQGHGSHSSNGNTNVVNLKPRQRDDESIPSRSETMGYGAEAA